MLGRVATKDVEPGRIAWAVGEELLILAVLGDRTLRRAVRRELDRRALYGSCPRVGGSSRLSWVGSRHAA